MRQTTKIGRGKNRIAYARTDDPINTKEATKQAVEILDANYGNVDLPIIITDTCTYLSHTEHSKLLLLIESYKELYDGTLGCFQTKPLSLDPKYSVTPHYRRPFPVAYDNMKILKGK